MEIGFICSCGKKLRTKEQVSGRRVRCPGCGAILKVPAPEPDSLGLVAQGPAGPPAPPRRGRGTLLLLVLVPLAVLVLLIGYLGMRTSQTGPKVFNVRILAAEGQPCREVPELENQTYSEYVGVSPESWRRMSGSSGDTPLSEMYHVREEAEKRRQRFREALGAEGQPLRLVVALEYEGRATSGQAGAPRPDCVYLALSPEYRIRAGIDFAKTYSGQDPVHLDGTALLRIAGEDLEEVGGGHHALRGSVELDGTLFGAGGSSDRPLTVFACDASGALSPPFEVRLDLEQFDRVENIIDVCKRAPDLYIERSRTYDRSMDPVSDALVVADIRHALRIAPGYAPARFELAVARLTPPENKLKVNRALTEVEEWIRAAPESADAYYFKGLAQLASGEGGLAKENLQKALAMDAKVVERMPGRLRVPYRRSDQPGGGFVVELPDRAASRGMSDLFPASQREDRP